MRWIITVNKIYTIVLINLVTQPFAKYTFLKWMIFSKLYKQQNTSAVKFSHLIWRSKRLNLGLKNITTMYCFCEEG